MHASTNQNSFCACQGSTSVALSFSTHPTNEYTYGCHENSDVRPRKTQNFNLMLSDIDILSNVSVDYF